MESFSFIQWALEHLNYWTVMLLMTIESSFIPCPSEIVVPPAAYLAAAGELNVYLVVLSATAGALIGALLNYGLSIWIGRAIVYKFVNSRLGHACLLNEQKMIKAESYFVKYGDLSTLVGRAGSGIRQLISIPAGLAKMPMGPFLLIRPLGHPVEQPSWQLSGIPCTRWFPKTSSWKKCTSTLRRFPGYCLGLEYWCSGTLSGK